jgi:heptosyltransferase I
MAEPRFLLVRLGSMGDVIHALPAASALRDTFPKARIDWVVDPAWRKLLEGNPDLSEVIPFDRKRAGGITAAFKKLRSAKYTCAVDFQALYKSAILAFASGAPRRIGFDSRYAREGLASLLYTHHFNPRGAHKVEHNLTLAEAAGARTSTPRFPIQIGAEDDELVQRELASRNLDEFFVLNPGGGWLSKCWPPERYGELHQKLATRYGFRGVVTFGPGEDRLAQDLVSAAGAPEPVAIPLGLGPLMALLRRAKFMVSADTGPLHLAAALCTPVVGLFGPTDPSRNGPFSSDSSRNLVVRNPRGCETTYRRGAAYSRSMLSITVGQVFNAIARRLEHNA